MTGQPQLIIASGVQKGARMRLPPGESRVGDDPGCSIVVADASSKAIEFHILVDDAIKLRGACDIVCSDGTTVAAGEVIDITRDYSFTAGNTLFQLELPQSQSLAAAPEAVKASRWRSMLPLSAGILTVGGLALIGFLVLGGAVPERSAAAIAPNQVRPGRLPTDMATAFLRERLDKSGFDLLNVAARADGALVVSGVMPPGQRDEWSAIRHAYDEKYGTLAVLVEQFDLPSVLPALHVAAVWSGVNPYVVDDHGNRLRPGANVGDGWSIEKIDEQNIVVRQGPRAVSLRY